MIQNIIVVILFLVALVYLVSVLRNEFIRKEGCRGCGACGAADLEKITKKLEEENLKLS
jgi:hypothetical protein